MVKTHIPCSTWGKSFNLSVPLIPAFGKEYYLLACGFFFFLMIIVIYFKLPQPKPAFYCVCITQSPMLIVDISCSCNINTSSPHHIPVGLQHISLLCFLHSLSTAWLSHSTWLLIQPVKCYFMDRRISRSRVTLQCSDPRSKEGFSVHQHSQWLKDAPGHQLVWSGAYTGEVPACTSPVLAVFLTTLFTSLYPEAGFQTVWTFDLTVIVIK